MLYCLIGCYEIRQLCEAVRLTSAMLLCIVVGELQKMCQNTYHDARVPGPSRAQKQRCIKNQKANIHKKYSTLFLTRWAQIGVQGAKSKCIGVIFHCAFFCFERPRKEKTLIKNETNPPKKQIHTYTYMYRE